MKSDVAIYKQRSIRLREYDYSQNGAYFVTICTQNSKKVFGNIFSGEMRLNEYGKVVENEWIKTRVLRTSVILDEFTIMPNHFHGIIILMNCNCRGTARRAPTVEKFGKPVRGSLPTIVRSFKSAATKGINELCGTPGVKVWQRNYYEHVIRDEDKLNKIRYYIQTNPLKWHLDRENPERIGYNVLEEEIF